MPLFWELKPDWRASFEVTHEFRTEIITSRSGKEQRIALRSEPRKRLRFTTTADRDRYRTMLRSFAGPAQGDSWYVAESTLWTGVLAGASGGGNQIAPAIILPWMAVGQRVVLAAGRRQGLYTISAVGGGQLTFVETFSAAWPAWTKVHPARLGYLKTEITGDDQTNNIVDLDVEFDLEPGTQLAETPVAPLATFNGRELFLRKPNWRERITDTFTSGRETVDYGRGRMAHFLPKVFPERMRRLVFVGRNGAETEALRQFFLRMRGQQGEFYMPTGMADIVPAAQLNSGQATMTVAGTAFATAYGDDTVHRAVAIHRTDGPTLYRVVNTISPSGGNSIIMFSTTWPANIPLTSIALVSWLPACRLASDSMLVEWLTDEVAQTALVIKTLEDLSGE